MLNKLYHRHKKLFDSIHIYSHIQFLCFLSRSAARSLGGCLFSVNYLLFLFQVKLNEHIFVDEYNFVVSWYALCACNCILVG